MQYSNVVMYIRQKGKHFPQQILHLISAVVIILFKFYSSQCQVQINYYFFFNPAHLVIRHPGGRESLILHSLIPRLNMACHCNSKNKGLQLSSTTGALNPAKTSKLRRVSQGLRRVPSGELQGWSYSLLKTEGLNWWQQFLPFFSLSTNSSLFSPKDRYSAQILEKLQENEQRRNISSQFQGTGGCTNNTLSNVNFHSVWVGFEIACQGTMWILSCVLFFLSLTSSIVHFLSLYFCPKLAQPEECPGCLLRLQFPTHLFSSDLTENQTLWGSALEICNSENFSGESHTQVSLGNTILPFIAYMLVQAFLLKSVCIADYGQRLYICFPKR